MGANFCRAGLEVAEIHWVFIPRRSAISSAVSSRPIVGSAVKASPRARYRMASRIPLRPTRCFRSPMRPVASSRRGCSRQLRAQSKSSSGEGRKGPPRRRLARIRVELRSPPAVPPNVACRNSGGRERCCGAARARDRERRRDLDRRAAAAHVRRTRPLHAALAPSRRTQQGRGAVRGRGPACARGAQSGGMADSTRAPLAGRGDVDSVAMAPGGIAFAIETKTRKLRRAPSQPCAGLGGVLVRSPAKLVPAGRGASDVRGSSSTDAAPGRRRARGIDRSPGVVPRKCGS